jgi:sporulation protein YtfJ
MSEHPIEGLMRTAMESIKDMIDVNTVVGQPVEVQDGVIIPVSRVSFGFAAGGGEYDTGAPSPMSGDGRTPELPFGGGSGAGVSVQPVGFLVVKGDDIRLLPVDANVILDRLVDAAPGLVQEIGHLVRGRSPESTGRELPDGTESPGYR